MPSLQSLKGKTTRFPTQNVNVTWTQLPEEIVEKYEVTVAIDIMAINKIPFMIRTSRIIHLGTTELIPDKTKQTLMISIQQIVCAYHTRGFCVLGDWGFECIRNSLADMGITPNFASRNEHIPEVERYIRTIKERVRVIASSLPFKKYPPKMIAEMVYNHVFWLNSFPHKDRVHTTIGPRPLLRGLAIEYPKHCKIAFGTYVQVHEEGDSTLWPRPRTSWDIVLLPTGNEQGRHAFLSLHSGKEISRYTWMERPSQMR